MVEVVVLTVPSPRPRPGRRVVPRPRYTGDEPCMTVDPDLWVTHQGRSTVALVKAMCRTCPVLRACREYALHHEAEGIWGGMTATERRAERRRRGIPFTTITLGD